MSKNVLILCKKVPYPATDGESIVILNDIQALSNLGFDVSVFCLNTKKHHINTTSYQDLLIWNDFQSSEIKPDSLKSIIKSIFSSFPFQIARFYSSKIDTALKKYLDKNRFDIIVYQGLAMTLYLKNIDSRKLYRVHNLEYKIWNELSKNSKNILKKLFYSGISKSLKNYEQKSLNDISDFITLSQKENIKLNKFYSKNLTTIPINISYKYSKIYDSKKEGLLFVGSLDWEPNLEGLEWFLNKIYPHLNSIPITIAGKGSYKLKQANSLITVVSNFDNIEDLFSNHRLMIVPLLSGAGIRIKLLEALKFGIPSISTAIGASDIEHLPESLIITDNPTEWISKINTYYASENSLSMKSKKCQSSYKEFYSEDIINEKWLTVIKKAP